MSSIILITTGINNNFLSKNIKDLSNNVLHKTNQFKSRYYSMLLLTVVSRYKFCLYASRCL